MKNNKIRNTLDGLERIQTNDVKSENHHFLVLSELNNWLANVATKYANGALLDYGCGGKPYESLFKPYISSYLGADVAVAKNSLVDVLLEPDAVVPFSDNSFETILSTQVLEHVPNPEFYITEAFRILKPGGHLILTAPMFWRHHEIPYDFTRFTRHGIQNICSKAGFGVLRIDACGGLISGLGQAILDSLASNGHIFPKINKVVNPIIQHFDQKYRDEDLTICWMAIAEKPLTIAKTGRPLPIINEKTRCPVCDSLRIASKFKWKEWMIAGCNTCDCDFVYPSPSVNQIKKAYDQPQYFNGNLEGGYKNYEEQTKPVLSMFDKLLKEIKSNTLGDRLLDVGCAFGMHLEIANSQGWKTTGIEISDHARQEASKRLAGKSDIFSGVGDLPSKPFDVVIIMDVIEHFVNPRQLFYDLFSKQIIQPNTIVVMTTPNVRSLECLEKGEKWEYYHPPYHLTYFSDTAMIHMLEELRFKNIEIRGIFPDLKSNNKTSKIDISTSSGVLAIASGSDFAAFMQERYVPGTWSRLTAYEHVPRYLFALQFAEGKRVLDFGCGTGYGSTILSEIADNVTGLDISEDAIQWAINKHNNSKINFIINNDLATSMPANKFEVVTCFEVIEHLHIEDQKKLIKNLHKILTEDGVLIISTPNSKMTALYGENPFHLNELSNEQFNELLKDSFPYVESYVEKIRPGVSISKEIEGEIVTTETSRLTSLCGENVCEHAAIVAVCSKQKIIGIESFTSWDSSCDYIFETIKGSPRIKTE